MTNDQIADVGKKVLKKCGSKSASIEINNTATADEIKQILRNSLYWYKREIVKSDEECAERLNEFFERMAETGEIPTVEKMCLALGTVRKVVWSWENGQGCSSARSNMIKKAKEILAAMDAELVSQGKIPQVSYIFRAKNFFQMTDQQQIIIEPAKPLGEEPDKKQLEERISGSIIDEE